MGTTPTASEQAHLSNMTTGAIKLHQLGTGVEEGIDLQKFEREAFPETRWEFEPAALSLAC